MASKISNILKNEKYMEDATLALFSNRIRAVKNRGDDYIWAIPTRTVFDTNEMEFRNEKRSKDNHTLNKSKEQIPLPYLRHAVSPAVFTISKSKEFIMQEAIPHDCTQNEVGESKKTVPRLKQTQDKNKKAHSNSGSELDIWGSVKPTEKHFNAGKGNTQTSEKRELSDRHHKTYLGSTEKKYEKNQQGKLRSSPLKNEFGTKHANAEKNTFQDWCHKRQTNYQCSVEIQMNDNISKKRIRHDSGTSIQSKSFKQKAQLNYPKQPAKQHNIRTPNNSSVEILLCIKVMSIGDEECCYDHITNMQDLSLIKKRFPKLSEILPDINGPQKEVNYGASIVKSVFGFLFNSCKYTLDRKLDGKMAIELLSAALLWEIGELHAILLKNFLENILHENNAKELYALANHFHLDEICDACTKITSKDVNGGVFRYKQKKCSVAVSTYQEPLEFCIPLQLTKPTLQDNYAKDIENEIIFEAISGYYTVMGMQIQLDCDSNNNNSCRMLKLGYITENISQEIRVEESELEKPLRRIIILHFKKNLLLKPHEKGKITLQIEIEPCLCPTLQEEEIMKSQKNEFSLSLKSNFKVNKSSKKRFLIKKIFYHIEAEEIFQ